MTRSNHLWSLPIERITPLRVEKDTWIDDCCYSSSGKKYDLKEDVTKQLEEKYEEGDFLGLI